MAKSKKYTFQKMPEDKEKELENQAARNRKRVSVVKK
jgi:hypothetical protein